MFFEIIAAEVKGIEIHATGCNLEQTWFGSISGSISIQPLFFFKLTILFMYVLEDNGLLFLFCLKENI